MIKLRDIKPDHENPRKMDEESSKTLSRSIKDFEDISGITWNRKTGELVCGHRRFKEIEEIYKNLSVSPEKDDHVELLNDGRVIGFRIRIVDWDKEKQKIANVVANTPFAQGQFDREKLKYVVETYKLQEAFPEYKLEELKTKIKFEEDVLKTRNFPHQTGFFERYTPAYIIELARTVMGSIDLDPASCETANKVVKASQYFTMKEDGLKQDWYGNVWMNPPYKKFLIDSMVEKIFSSERLKQAIVLTLNNTDSLWGQTLLKKGSITLFPKGRVRFLDETLKELPSTPFQGTMITGYKVDIEKFKEVFGKTGQCLMRY